MHLGISPNMVRLKTCIFVYMTDCVVALLAAALPSWDCVTPDVCRAMPMESGLQARMCRAKMAAIASDLPLPVREPQARLSLTGAAALSSLQSHYSAVPCTLCCDIPKAADQGLGMGQACRGSSSIVMSRELFDQMVMPQ